MIKAVQEVAIHCSCRMPDSKNSYIGSQNWSPSIGIISGPSGRTKLAARIDPGD